MKHNLEIKGEGHEKVTKYTKNEVFNFSIQNRMMKTPYESDQWLQSNSRLNQSTE